MCFLFMFWTAGHLSTPFWCFAALESSSHPLAHNLLCAHRTEMASVHTGKEREVDGNVMRLHLKIVSKIKLTFLRIM